LIWAPTEKYIRLATLQEAIIIDVGGLVEKW
jgi:hypothetical protein